MKYPHTQLKNLTTGIVEADATRQKQTGLQYELILVAFADSMRTAGYSRDWLDCEVRSLTDSNAKSFLQIRLTMRNCNGDLLRRSLELQKDIISRLTRYQPHVDYSTFDWVWKYSDECVVTEKVMPPVQEYALGQTALLRQSKLVSAGKLAEQVTDLPDSPVNKKHDEKLLQNIFSYL